MFDSIKEYLTGRNILKGEIQSHEGDIYIARLLDQNDNIIATSSEHFSSMICARDWLRNHGARSINLSQSAAYNEMINN